ncbi:hypothetical protein COW36_23480 [bacterium (Candidatus Blackallbacteria) CG17_big_fil_post_rev_8_21_14_2_50_48_46]|uniref:Uncharacterized protein n=1 Tax=bacterium (Candidatus Blackallbacteria) CG17_big_fil_post_rev_8_21_14_2_50_48_46 TaxID=2014261 RepID=A0A2M7FXJ2_9BACT|nr:MAG: hypothetical protein COW64_17690 [bacterium (Candidatus Blackallbacteria) CG18_big_fil_WC_8_21_14_2_50_49_26]PIW14004.1 MAG: hypothetical protein COW36_23480 [bacterium (Candidatus Blackallbacteria) CG17_big_fil_post_rev_8_21_14_2_50_48_46]PIW46855.1 MAG: hypothetical protein COW20_14655 [bacterium (Candidatus Blackallbacteria) CG13_big_fil_rev_8_21_14_2_50_49_14]
MSADSGEEKLEQASPSHEEAPSPTSTLFLEGEIRVKASMSMLFSDILSQELSASIAAPDSISVLQKYLRNKPLDQLNPSELKPFLENIPAPIADVIKEAVFCSGAAIKRMQCKYPINIGDRFIFRGSGLMADLELLDGKVVSIQPLKKR